MRFIYLFLNFPYLWKCKIGISRNWKLRRKYVCKSTPGIVVPVWAVYVPFARKLERQLHGFFRYFKSSFRRGSGRSEWFLTLPVLPIAWLIINFMFVLFWAPVWLAMVWFYKWLNG